MIPLAPFLAERYLMELRDATADAPEGSAREIAHLWARGCLDARFDCLLIPVLVRAEDEPIAEALERRNVERGWGLPEGYFRERLEYGGCLVLAEDREEVRELNSDILFTGKYLQLLRTGPGWEFVRRTGGAHGVAIVAITEEFRILLVEQYRPPVDGNVIELPAGLVASGEDPADTAKRELLEETGYVCDTVEVLGTGTSSAGLTDERNTLYRAGTLTRAEISGDDLQLEDGVIRHGTYRGVVAEGEKITVYEVPVDLLRPWLERQGSAGKLIDLKVFAALSFV